MIFLPVTGFVHQGHIWIINDNDNDLAGDLLKVKSSQKTSEDPLMHRYST